MALFMSIHIVIYLSKCGSEKAIIETVKKMQRDNGISVGCLTYTLAVVSPYLTGAAVVYTAYLTYTSVAGKVAVTVIATLIVVCGILSSIFMSQVSDPDDEEVESNV